MSIEDLIRTNTEAILGLTEAMSSLERLLNRESASKPSVETQKAPASVNTKPNVDYQTVKGLISKLALEHRDAIKELNKKYGLPVFADLLLDKDDISKGVKDPKKLEAYYQDIVLLDH